MTTLTTTPAKIGRYPVLRVLGKGAMGCVYLARDIELERDVAIKTVRMPQGIAEQESFLVRFRNEARAVGRLRHRSIVSVYDVGNDPDSGPFLVFEYIEGANLKDILRSKGPLTPQYVVALAEQVGGALDAAHAEGIIHRDIKPENLLVGKDQVVHLADFGVARVPDAALTGEGQFLGTPCYGAPETLLGGEAGPLSDQFSFAAVLYEAASGTRAFPGSEALAVAHAVIHDQPRAPSKVADPQAKLARGVDDVILRALSKQPEDRFASISELVQALRLAYARASLLPLPGSGETMPALLSSPRGSRSKPPAKKVPLWPIALFLVAGVVAAFQLVPSAPASEGELATTAVAQGGARVDTMVPVAAALVDAALLVDPGDAALVDAALTEAGEALDGEPQLSSFEREERAKDALERAEKALSVGDRDAAKAALDEAEGYDPEHPDIAALRRKL